MAAGGDLRQEPANAHRHDLLRADGQVGAEALQHPVETVEFGRAGATGQADHRQAFNLSHQDQVAGIDGHAEMVHLATGLDDSCRQSILAVYDGRRAGDQHEVRFVGEGFAQGLGDGVCRVGAAALPR